VVSMRRLDEKCGIAVVEGINHFFSVAR
jgi:hypothetical protein